MYCGHLVCDTMHRVPMVISVTTHETAEESPGTPQSNVSQCCTSDMSYVDISLEKVQCPVYTL